MFKSISVLASTVAFAAAYVVDATHTVTASALHPAELVIAGLFFLALHFSGVEEHVLGHDRKDSK